MSTVVTTRTSPSLSTTTTRRSVHRHRKAPEPHGHSIWALMYSNLTDSSLIWFLLIGISLTVLSAVGSADKIVDDLTISNQNAVDEAGLHFLRLGFALLLFVAMWGAGRVTKEFQDATIATHIAEHGGTGRLILHHALASLPGGILFGVAGLFSGAVPGYLILHRNGAAMTIDGDVYRTALGIILVSTLAAPWGTCFGWLLRRTIPSALVLIAWTTFLEPIIVTWLPERVGKYLPGNLQSALVLDPKATGDIHQAPAAALLIAWTVTLSVIVFVGTRSRDLRG